MLRVTTIDYTNLTAQTFETQRTPPSGRKEIEKLPVAGVSCFMLDSQFHFRVDCSISWYKICSLIPFRGTLWLQS
jgi:hypothetical protein